MARPRSPQTPNRIRHVRPGDAVRAETTNAIIDAVRAGLLRVKKGSGLTIKVTGQAVEIGADEVVSGGVIIYKSTGAISGRSGTTPGFGNARIVAATHTSLASLVGSTVVVHNTFSTGSNVTAGKYGQGGMDENGLHWAVWEC